MSPATASAYCLEPFPREGDPVRAHTLKELKRQEAHAGRVSGASTEEEKAAQRENPWKFAEDLNRVFS